MNDSAKNIKNILKIIKILFAFSIITATVSTAFLFFWCAEYLNAPNALTENKIVIIEKGSSLTSVANKLSDEQIISHPKAFTLINRLTKKNKRVQAGQYNFSANISPRQTFDQITSGDVMVHNVTFAEGLMAFQMIEIINNAPYLTGSIPENIKEGDLLPETYEYNYNDSRASIINRMRDNMKKTLDFAWKNRADNLPIKSKKEALTLASIIEKETGVASERKRVSAVFINRLRKKMRLQTDPTVIYAVTKGKFVLDRPIRRSELQANSPYNTYRNYGLPPSPIASPGKSAIEAALNPIRSNEIYFVADGSGGHKFSSNLKQHNRNVVNWRKINKQK